MANAAVILDCRNTYESDVGAFEGAIPIETICSGATCRGSAQEGGQVFDMVIDRIPPNVEITSPTTADPIFRDDVAGTSGVQTTVQVEACQAPGGTVTLTTSSGYSASQTIPDTGTGYRQ